jgi:hypothetical protein
MAKFRQFARPMMRASARFHTTQPSFIVGEKRQQLRLSERAIKGDLVGWSDPVNLRSLLGQIKADCENLHLVASLMRADMNICSMAHCDAGWSRSHPSHQQSQPALRHDRA